MRLVPCPSAPGAMAPLARARTMGQGGGKGGRRMAAGRGRRDGTGPWGERHREAPPMSGAVTVFVRQYFHGTKADLRPGDLISVGYSSNFAGGAALSWVYCSGTLDAAIWGAELAMGEGPGRSYVVEPAGELVDDPNVTDKKFPAIRPCPIAAARPCGWSARSWAGRATRPRRSRRCETGWPGCGRRGTTASLTERAGPRPKRPP